MAELIPTISFTEFKRLKPEQLKELKSCEVTFNCEYLFTFVNPQTSFIRVQTEYMCQTGNDIGGKDLDTVKEMQGELNAAL